MSGHKQISHLKSLSELTLEEIVIFTFFFSSNLPTTTTTKKINLNCFKKSMLLFSKDVSNVTVKTRDTTDEQIQKWYDHFHKILSVFYTDNKKY